MRSRLGDVFRWIVALAIVSGDSGAADTVATNSPPVVRYGFANVAQSALAVDSAGNKYFTGFVPAGTVDFNLGVGEDTKTLSSQTGFVTRINANGTYGWTQIITGSSNQGSALLLSADEQTLYWAGSFFSTARIGTTGNTITSAGSDDGFIAALDPATGAAKTAFGMNSSGLQRVGGTLSDLATSLAISGNTLYVGGRFSSTACTAGTLTSSISTLGSLDCFVLALDAANGSPIINFGFNGSAIQTIGGASNAEFLRGLATDGTTVYVAADGSSSTLQIGNDPSIPNTSQSGFVAALNATTGTAVNTFGFASSGIQRFGSNVDGLLLSGTTLYCCGMISNSIQIGNAPAVTGFANGFVASLDKGNGQANASFGLSGSGIQKFGGSSPAALGYSMVLGPSALFVCGYTSFACQIGGTGPVVPVPSPSTEGLVLALNPTTGTAVTSFGINSSGMQTIGGTGADIAVSIKLDGSRLVVLLQSSSADAGIGGLGTINSTSFGGLLVPLDAQTGTYPYPVIAGPFISALPVNAPASIQIQTTGNPNLFTATNLPSGLTLNPNTGLISGTPVTAGSSTCVVTASNTAGTVAAQMAIAVVNDALAATYPPVIQGTILGSGQAVAVDAAGNRYVAGTFGGNVDFNPSPGINPRSSAGSNDAFITRYNADGTYAWTATFGGSGDDGAQAVIASLDNQTIYVAGYYTSNDARINNTGLIAPANSSLSTDGFVLALNASNGTAKTSFGVGGTGVQRWGGNLDDRLTALALSPTTLYVAGYFLSTIPVLGTTNQGILNSGSSTADAGIIALNPTTGAAVTTFGLSGTGVQHFGGALDDRANSLMYNNGILYVGGTYSSTDAHIGSNTTNVGTFGSTDGFVVALDGNTGAAVTTFGLSSSGIQHFGSLSADAARGMIYANNSLYITGDIDNGAQVGGTGSALGTQGGVDAVVVCLDGTTGLAKTTFGLGTTAMQIVGGSVVDQGFGLALSGSTLYLAGSFSSSTLKIVGGNIINNSGLTNAFVAAMDLTTGTPITGFGLSGSGIQKFGGSSIDKALGIAISGGTISVGGSITSTNAGVGGTGTFSGAGFGGYLLSLSTTGPSNPPTNITLNNQSVPEHLPVGTLVGTFSTADVDSASFTYALVTGTGSTDNASFSIVGSTLRTASVFDVATKSSYSVRVRSTDPTALFFEKAFTITVTPAGNTPTDITLSNSSVAENVLGPAIGTFSTTDADAGDTFTYTLVTGTGSTDNGSFSITGSSLTNTVSFNYEVKNQYSIRVRTTDSASQTFEKVFVINVTDVNEAPGSVLLGTASVPENSPLQTTVGTLTTLDPDVGDVITYTLVTGTGATDNALFSISGNALRTAAVFDYEAKSSYSVRVRGTDQAGLFAEAAFTITIINVNEPPTDIFLSFSGIAENSPVGTTVGTFGSFDPDTSNTFTYTLVSGAGDTDNASFTIATGGVLKTAVVFDYETRNALTIRVRSTDQGGAFFERIQTVFVTNVNEAPTDIVLSKQTVPEGPAGVQVGTFGSIDPDANNTFTYSLVPGVGGDDNGSFTIIGNALRTTGPTDFEIKNSYTTRVRSTDNGGAFFEKVFVISVTNTNERPTLCLLSNKTMFENSPVGATVGVLSTADLDPGDTFTYALIGGPGSNDNDKFGIQGNALVTAAVFDYEQQGSLKVRVRATDSGGLFVDAAFTIQVLNVNEAPTDIRLSSAEIPENVLFAPVGEFSAIDPDANQTFTYELVDGPGSDDNESFMIQGSTLLVIAPFDFEQTLGCSIRVRCTDGGGKSIEKAFAIGITDVPEAPTAIMLTATTVSETAAIGSMVAGFITQDPDSNSFTYTLVGTTDTTQNAYFKIEGDKLLLAAPLDFETMPQLLIHVASTDSTGLSIESDFVINVLDEDESPPQITSAPTASGAVGVPFSYAMTSTGGTPIAFSLSSPLPAGLSRVGDTISGVPSVQGIVPIVFTAVNPYGVATQVMMLTISGDDPVAPVITSIFGTATPGVAGKPVSLSAAVLSTHLTLVTWDFGDGSPGNGPSVQHIYSAPGIYTAAATVTDGTHTITKLVTVTVSAAPQSQGIIIFAVTKAALKFDFKKHADSLKLTCDVPLPQNFASAGQTLEVAIGDYRYVTTLTAKGIGGDATHKVKLSGALKDGRYSGGSAVLTLSLSKQNLFDALKAYGFKNADVSGERVPLPVSLLLGGQGDTDTPVFIYSATAGKFGSGTVKY